MTDGTGTDITVQELTALALVLTLVLMLLELVLTIRALELIVLVPTILVLVLSVLALVLMVLALILMTKLFTGLLQPTFKEGTSSFVFGGPYGPEGEPPPLKIDQNSLILDFNCQPLRKVLICFMSVGPYGPGGVLVDFEGGRGPQSLF